MNEGQINSVRTIYNLPFLSVRAPQIEKPNQDTKQKRAQSVSKYEEEETLALSFDPKNKQKTWRPATESADLYKGFAGAPAQKYIFPHFSNARPCILHQKLYSHILAAAADHS